jgi:hypothetical protein
VGALSFISSRFRLVFLRTGCMKARDQLFEIFHPLAFQIRITSMDGIIEPLISLGSCLLPHSSPRGGMKLSMYISSHSISSKKIKKSEKERREKGGAKGEKSRVE